MLSTHFNKFSIFAGFKPDKEKNKLIKPKSTYIPDDPTEDDNEIFGNHISSGINFEKYDDIEVKVSGKNPPKSINSFNEAGLCSTLINLINKCQYHKPTPIQKHCIPIIMSGRDLMGCAQTGSGKTVGLPYKFICVEIHHNYVIKCFKYFRQHF